MPTAFRLPPRPVHATVPRVKAVDGLRKEFTHLSNINSNGARVIYVTGTYLNNARHFIAFKYCLRL